VLDQVEGEQHRLTATALAPKRLEVRRPVIAGDPDLAVGSGTIALEVECSVNKVGEAIGPVVTVAERSSGRARYPAHYHPVAVMLDFVNFLNLDFFFLAVFFTGDFFAVFSAFLATFFTAFFAVFLGAFAALATAFAAILTVFGVRFATAFLARLATAFTAVFASSPAARQPRRSSGRPTVFPSRRPFRFLPSQVEGLRQAA
jgi:hypothetical protein